MTHTWQKIRWKEVEQDIRQMQAELVKTVQAGNERGMIYWQNRIVQSHAAKLLAVRQVTTNNGRHTAGVDGIRWTTPQHKQQAVTRLGSKGYRPQPARRVYIPKHDGRMRPLGILTMHDRAMQALYLLALDPVAETLTDPHSYGFRKQRSITDAILACAEIFTTKDGPQWVLEADIEECFDSISHDWLLRHIPLPKPILRSWLRAGYMEKGCLHKPPAGLPQGGIISPVLANMALNGMEEMLLTYFHRTPQSREQSRISVVRYADDFIVAGANKRMLDKDVKSLLTNFLKERGMRFSARKTRLTKITDGFEFLGYFMKADTSLFGGYRLTIIPGDKSARHLLERVERVLQKHRQATPAALIQALNLILRGWAGHYTLLEDRTVFARLDQAIMDMLIAWAKGRHPRKSKRWIMKHYFTKQQTGVPVFTDQQGQALCCLQTLPVKTYTPIDPNCNVYDPKWADYLKQR